MNSTTDLLRDLDATDRRMRDLISDLEQRDLTVPYDRGINPPIWEMGHAAFFYEYFLLRELDDATPRMPGCDGIWDSFQNAHEDRFGEGVVPDRDTTLAYYTRILDEVRGRLTRGTPDAHEAFLCRYGIGHQNMHVESMIWCRQTLGYPPPPSAIDAPNEPDDHDLATGDVEIAGGRYPIGMPATGFSFDNERPGFDREIAPFRIARTLVSNGELLEFVESGGYDSPDAWSYCGRRWLRESESKHPLYWRRDSSGTWQLRHFDRWIDIPMKAPVLHINAWEADAFAKWAGRRLPTEYEWEAAARGSQGRAYPWGDTMDPARVDMDGTALGRMATDALPEGATPTGCLQMIGTAWEWTSNPFLPYDGFAVDMYPFMSTLQFGDHVTTKGGSCATSSCLIRSSYRQAYFPDRRDAFTGFRTCAR